MIAKHVAMRSVRKSDFGELARYITDPQGVAERIGYTAITNCHSDSVEMAAIEVRGTQLRNTRSEADKTYHLIVSFRVGEQPSAAVLKAVEERICQGLGFGEHQRVSAAHHDTDNVHLHIAINKVHPTRYTVHAPYNDHKMLGKLCEALEKEHGLQADNHAVQKHGAQNRAQDMERHAGVDSLIGWVRRECLDRINSASSWAALHDVMREHGLELRERGNGFIIGDAAGTQAKASSIARLLSKPQIEKRLGQFAPSQHPPIGQHFSPRVRYEKKPVRSRIDTTELHTQYKQEQQGASAARMAEANALRQRQFGQIEAVKHTSRVKRGAIRLLGGGRFAKKVLYALASRALKAELAKVREQHRRERQWLKRQYARRVWADWLKAKATQGDQAALHALRARESRQGLKGNVIAATGQRSDQPGLAAVQDAVTKKGSVIYRVGDSAIRDDGERLQVSRGADRGGIDAALRMAIQRYGNHISVAGSDEFKSRVVAAAASAALPITFSDAALEQRRQSLSATITKGTTHDDQDRRRIHAGGDAIAQPGAVGRDRAEPARQSRGRLGRSGGVGTGGAVRAAGAGRPAEHRKPNVSRIGAKPPPEGKNRLRNLSQLGMVQLAEGSEVLLPRDVPGHVEQPGAAPTHPLRRPLSGPGRVAEGDAALEKFIAEREQKRSTIFGIPKYTRYTADMETVAAYAGTRNIDGRFLALLKRGDNVEVLPIDQATARRLKRVKVGDAVTITDTGRIKMRGRIR